jgi:hypothetical protein
MKPIECAYCFTLLFIDENENLTTTPSSDFEKDEEVATKINIRCKRCKKHNIIHN